MLYIIIIIIIILIRTSKSKEYRKIQVANNKLIKNQYIPICASDIKYMYI